MRNEPIYSPVATRYRDFNITPALLRVDGTFIAHSCIVSTLEGDIVFRLQVDQVCPDLETAQTVAIEAGKRRIDAMFGPAK